MKRVHVRLSARTGDCQGSTGGQGAMDIRMGRSKRKVGWGARRRAGLGVREHRAGRHVKPGPLSSPWREVAVAGGLRGEKKKWEL